MEYHTYNSLNKTIKEQYSRPNKNKIEIKEDKIIKNIINTYNEPTINNIINTVKIISENENLKEKREEKEEEYLYIHKNYI